MAIVEPHEERRLVVGPVHLQDLAGAVVLADLRLGTQSRSLVAARMADHLQGGWTLLRYT